MRFLRSLLCFAALALPTCGPVHAQIPGGYILLKVKKGGGQAGYEDVLIQNTPGTFIGFDGSGAPMSGVPAGGGGGGLTNIASAITGNTLTFSGALGAGRTLTVRDLAGTIALTGDFATFAGTSNITTVGTLVAGNIPASLILSGTLDAARLPLPTASTIGGVKRNTGSGGQFVTGIDSSGNLTYGTPSGTGDMLKSIYDSGNNGYITGRNNGGILIIDKGNAMGGVAGSGGNIIAAGGNGAEDGGVTASGGASGYLNISGGHALVDAGIGWQGGAGGYIVAQGSDAGPGYEGQPAGFINLSAVADRVGGSITTAGGGSINTSGVGRIELGQFGTQTVLEGGGLGDTFIKFPPGPGAPGYALVTDGSGSTDWEPTVLQVSQPANRILAGPTAGGNANPTFRTLVLADLPSGVGLTSGHLGQFAATTSAQLRGVISDESGTGALLFAGGNIGVATATSLNGLTITSTTGTLTIASGKTLTSSNTLTLAGTDGSTLNIGTGGTLGGSAFLSVGTGSGTVAAGNHTHAKLDALQSAVTIASASTTSIGGQADVVNVSGTTTITSFGSGTEGERHTLIFAGALTLTHNATSLIIPGGSNFTTAAGDTMTVRSIGGSNWRLDPVYWNSSGNLCHVNTGTSSLGTSGRRWADGYFGNNVYANGVTINSVFVLSTRRIYSLSASGTNTAANDTYLDGQQGTGTGTPGKVVVRTPVLGTSGSTSQTLQDTLTVSRSGIETDVPILMSEQASPSGPAPAGKVYLYPKSDGKYYIKDDAGMETDITTSGGGGGSGPDVTVAAHKAGTDQSSVGNNAWTMITWSTEVSDPDSDFASSQLTVASGEVWLLTSAITINTATNNTPCRLSVYKDGAEYLIPDSNGSYAAPIALQANEILTEAGVYDLRVYSNNGVPVTVEGTATETYIRARRLK